jgi:hypothetical protein
LAKQFYNRKIKLKKTTIIVLEIREKHLDIQYLDD